MRNHLDAQISAAMQDLPVPEGMAERVLSRLGVPTDLTAKQTGQPGRVCRRRTWFFIASGVAAAAAILLAALWLGSSKEEPLPQQLVLTEAIRWFTDVLEADEQAWAGASAAGRKNYPPSAEFPPSDKVLGALGARWKPLHDFLDLPGVVYYLDGIRGVRGVLLVVAGKITELSYLPPAHSFSTGGCSAAAWQEETLTYILVVRGGANTFRSFLNLPRSPLALGPTFPGQVGTQPSRRP